MKKGISLLLCGAMLMTLLTGCGSTPAASEAADTAESGAAAAEDDKAAAAGETAEGEESAQPSAAEGAKIGFLAPTLQTEFFIGIDDGLKEECKNRGWDYISVSFDNDSAAAVSAIENMVTGGCNVIIAMISDTSCDDALREAQKAGVKVMECGVKTEVYDCCLNTDQHGIGVNIGEMASDWINDKLGGKGNVVVYTTYQNEDMQRRGEGIQEALKANAPDANILEVVDIGKDVVGSGTTTTETMLQKYPDLNCIVAYGDAAAVESMEAVKAAGIDSEGFGIFACDGTEQALKGIAGKDIMKGTIAFEPLAPQMAEYCGKLLEGETFAEVVNTPVHKITGENVADFYTAQ